MSKRMDDVAAQAAVNTPKITRRKEFEGELNFITNVEQLNKKLEADNIVAQFLDPEDPEAGEPIIFEMRPMTPGEFAIYYQTLLGHTFLETAAANPKTDTELEDEQQEKLIDELAVKKYDDKLLNILESCIISHPLLTAEDMRTWDPFYVMSLHNALLGGSRPSKSVARFSGLDSGSGE